jgi:hypothetical protein
LAIRSNISIKASPQYINHIIYGERSGEQYINATVIEPITIPIAFSKWLIIISSKLFSLIRSPESSVAQSPLGEPFHYFANYPYNCPAEICQHCPNCYNNQPKRLLKRVHIQWIHFRFLQVSLSLFRLPKSSVAQILLSEKVDYFAQYSDSRQSTV